MAYKGCGKHTTISEFYKKVEQDEELSNALFTDQIFKEKIFPFELLKVDGGDLLTPLLNILLEAYDIEEQVFTFNSVRFCITLEDILFLTGLPIMGKLITKANKSPDSFKDFGPELDGKIQCKIIKMRSIALDKEKHIKLRIKAVILTLIACFVVPSGDGHRIKGDYVRYVDELGNVASFAWGAALLAFLYSGIRKWKTMKKSHMDGNLWVVLAFFMIRIPHLRALIGIEFNDVNQDSEFPLILEYVQAMSKISHNHTTPYDKVKNFLENLTEKDIVWTPYAGLLPKLPDNLKEQVNYGLFLGPICFMNYLVCHKPHLAMKQFPRLKDVKLDLLTWEEPVLKLKENSGRFPQNFEKIYNNFLTDWKSRKLVTDYLPEEPVEKGSTRNNNGDNSYHYREKDSSSESETDVQLLDLLSATSRKNLGRRKRKASLLGNQELQHKSAEKWEEQKATEGNNQGNDDATQMKKADDAVARIAIRYTRKIRKRMETTEHSPGDQGNDDVSQMKKAEEQLGLKSEENEDDKNDEVTVRMEKLKGMMRLLRRKNQGSLKTNIRYKIKRKKMTIMRWR